MRFSIVIIFSILVLSLSSCKAHKTLREEKTLLKFDTINKVSKKLYLLKNKKLEISTQNGDLNYTIENSDSTSVMQFIYEKNSDQAAFDGGYREEVVFEIPNDNVGRNYNDEELQNTKMLFGRYCYCRGQTGLYKVNKGNLKVTASKNNPHFELNFKITEVPQVTATISY